METTVNEELVQACRKKQQDYMYQDMDKEFMELVMNELEEEFAMEEMRQEAAFWGKEDWEERVRPRVPSGPLPQHALDRLRAQGKETPQEYKARRARVAQLKQDRAVEKEEKKAHDELPVPPKPTVEFRLALQQARQSAKMTQETLASTCRVKKKVVADWEAGRATVPSAKMAIIKRVLKM